MSRTKLLLAAALLSASGAFARDPVKRYLAYGWDTENITPADLLSGAKDYEELGFDGAGVSIEPRRTADGRVLTRQNVFDGRTAWKWEDVKGYLPTLRKIALTPGVSHSMIHFLLTCKSRLRWDDDTRWKVTADNILIMARLAKEAGLPGLCFDNEDYFQVDQYVRQAEDPLYDEAARLARQRGREIFGPVFREYPNIVLHFYFLMDLLWETYDTNDPAAVARSRQELLPAFLDGIFDVIPPTAKLVDGCEMSYTATTENNNFRRLASHVLAGACPLLSPENRAKYRAQNSLSFATYLDAYVSTNASWSYYQKPMANGSRLQRLEQNLVEMNRYADDYVWFWGERMNYAVYNRPGRKKDWLDKRVTWKEVLPGLGQVIRGVKDPYGYVGCELAARRAAGTLTNLVAQGKVSCSIWKQPCVALTNDVFESAAHPHAMLAHGLTSGGFSYAVNSVRPGEWYGVEVRASNSNLGGYVNWRDKSGKWHNKGAAYVAYWDVREADADGWYTGRILARVPEGVTSFVVMFWPKGQRPEDKTYYDGLTVVCLRAGE